MSLDSIKNTILESPLGYKLWSAPFNVPKVAAIKRMLERLGPNDRTILDVGCGPGTNAELFRNWDYTGIDINPQYISLASSKFTGMRFKACDAASLNVGDRKFSLVLINSILHHLDDDQCRNVFDGVSRVLAKGGSIIVNEPIMPPANERFKTLMMEQDRGDFFRSEESWQTLFSESGFKIAAEDRYVMKLFGVVGWDMYCTTLRNDDAGQ